MEHNPTRRSLFSEVNTSTLSDLTSKEIKITDLINYYNYCKETKGVWNDLTITVEHRLAQVF